VVILVRYTADSLCLKATFFGVDGFEKYRPHIEATVGSLSKESLVNFRMAISEAICNAIRYADNTAMAKVVVQVRFKKKLIIAKVTSFNASFDVKKYLEPLRNIAADNVWDMLKTKNRGRGLWIMLSCSDRVIFSADGSDVILVTRVNQRPKMECETRKLLSKVYVV
jgi:anti-sigma regulatory factor (Ser/Thr protein kinase)